MRFRFQFQKILDLRGKEKEQMQAALAASIKKLEEEKEAHESLLKTLAEQESHFLQSQKGNMKISQYIEWNAYHHHLNEQINNSSKMLAKTEKEVEQRMRQVANKAKEEKIWQLLKEKEFKRYRLQENRIEQNQLDEISTNRYLRSNY